MDSFKKPCQRTIQTVNISLNMSVVSQRNEKTKNNDTAVIY